MLSGMKAYALDLRQRMIAAVERGMRQRAVAELFGVSLSTVKRLAAKHRAGHDLAPQSSPGRPRTITPEHHARLTDQLAADPDATTQEQAAHWNATTGMAVSARTMRRAIRRLGWTRKKSRWVPASVMSRPERPSASR